MRRSMADYCAAAYSRVNFVSAQRDRVLACYAVLAATGQLSAARLNLDVVPYHSAAYFEQVKDKWIGVSTPSGE